MRLSTPRLFPVMDWGRSRPRNMYLQDQDIIFLSPLFSENNLKRTVNSIKRQNLGDERKEKDSSGKLGSQKDNLRSKSVCFHPKEQRDAQVEKLWRTKLNFGGFCPRDIRITRQERGLIIHAKRASLNGSGAYTSSEISRFVRFPENLKHDELNVWMDSATGMLIIEAPRVDLKAKGAVYLSPNKRSCPVTLERKVSGFNKETDEEGDEECESLDSMETFVSEEHEDCPLDEEEKDYVWPRKGSNLAEEQLKETDPDSGNSPESLQMVESKHGEEESMSVNDREELYANPIQSCTDETLQSSDSRKSLELDNSDDPELREGEVNNKVTTEPENDDELRDSYMTETPTDTKHEGSAPNVKETGTEHYTVTYNEELIKSETNVYSNKDDYDQEISSESTEYNTQVKDVSSENLLGCDKVESGESPENKSEMQVKEENSGVFQVEIMLPSYDPRDIKVKLVGHTVHIRAEQTQEENGMNWCNTMEKSFTLPEGIDPDSISSTVNDEGRLKITGSKFRENGLLPEMDILVKRV